MTASYLLRRDLSRPVPPADWPADVDVGPVRDDEAEAAHGVLEAAYADGAGEAPSFAFWWQSLHRDSEFDPALLLAARRCGDVLALAHGWRTAFIKDLAVRHDAQRRGLARALLRTLLRTYATRGCETVLLKVRADNEAALALYRSEGFVAAS